MGNGSSTCGGRQWQQYLRCQLRLWCRRQMMAPWSLCQLCLEPAAGLRCRCRQWMCRRNEYLVDLLWQRRSALTERHERAPFGHSVLKLHIAIAK